MGCAIASGHPATAAIGQRILDSGGNAFDSALAIAFLQGVVDPAKCGIGGWGTAVCLAAGAARGIAIDFPAVAGSLARPDQWADIVISEAYHGYLPVLRGSVNDAGYGAIGVPTCVRGFGAIHERFGSMPWGTLLEPAIRAAADGVPVVDGVLGAGRPEWDWPGAMPLGLRLSMSTLGARRYLREGRLVRVGERLVQPELASTLSTLAIDGPDPFYTGPVGDLLAADLHAGGSTVTRDDLLGYRPRIGDAVAIDAHGRRVFGAPPPESGVSIAQALLVLDGQLDLASGPLGQDTLGLVVDALDWVGTERTAHLGDPMFDPMDVTSMLDRARQRTRRTSVGPHRGSAGHTTGVVVIDDAGNAIAMNHSLAGTAGSGVMPHGLGFLLNNAMAGFDARPGGRNAIAPGKARWSAACPTLITGPSATDIIAVTAPGGSRAVAAVIEVILDLTVFGMAAVDAVATPRYDAHDGVVDVEADVPFSARVAVQEAGRRTIELAGPAVAAVYAAVRGPSGVFDAAADPRWPGSSVAA